MPFVVRAKKMRLDGERVVDDGVLIVDGGRIRAAGAGVEIPGGYSVIEHDGFVSAGLVACHGFSGARGDTFEPKRAVTPGARVIDAFDAQHPDVQRALESGITTLVLTPWTGNVAGGVTAVVKTSGGRVVSDEAHLSLTFATSALRTNRYPTSVVGAVNELEKRFEKPEGVFERAATGNLPVLLECTTRDELERALAFATRHKLRGALYGSALAGELADDIAKSGLSLIVAPLGLGVAPRTLNSLPQLAQAKVPLAFGVDAPWNSNESARWSAAMCVRAGVPVAAAWNGLTADGAAAAGVGDRIGKLERGYDADFVLWSGDPLDLASGVRAVYVDGRLAFESAQGAKQ
jgi:imidazolonepropionase-like amidohydrolase